MFRAWAYTQHDTDRRFLVLCINDTSNRPAVHEMHSIHSPICLQKAADHWLNFKNFYHLQAYILYYFIPVLSDTYRVVQKFGKY